MNMKRYNLPLLPVVLFPLLFTVPVSGAGDESPANPVVVQRLIGDLKQNDWILQASALKMLGEMKAVEASATILEIAQTASNDWIRAQALIALARIKPQAAQSTAGGLLGNPDVEVRILGLRALELSRDPAGLTMVKKAAEDTNSRVRWAALAAQAAIDGEAAWAGIEQAMKALAAPDEAGATREIARALAYVGSTNSWRWIDQLLDNHRKDDRIQAVIRGLTDVHDPRLIIRLVHVQQTIRDDPVGNRLCQAALRGYSKDELSVAVRHVFQSANTNDFPSAARIAGTLCPGLELGELISSTVTRDPDIKAEVLGACLDALSNPQMEPARYQALYQRCLTVGDPAIRRAAVHGLEKCENADLFEILGPSLRDESLEVRRAALSVLSSLPQSRAPVDVAGYVRKFLLADLGGAKADRRTDIVVALSGVFGIRQQVEIARPQGYVTDWMVLGAFPSDEKNTGFGQKFGPEDKIDFTQKFKTEYGWTGEGAEKGVVQEREIAWQRSSLVLGDGMLSLGYVMPPTKYGVCYAVADVRSEKARSAVATLSANDCAVLWLNGRQLTRLEPAGAQETSPVVTGEVQLPLVEGVNRLVVKVANLGNDWSVGVRFHDAGGAAVLLPSAFAAEEKTAE